ncbi:hypothetical protein GCM10025886_16480 [Tetragenococcus halophilus subsp. flandriensis]|uniref:MerR family transcriptional regulator n=1 Tax=Tetragenococcus halophilus TaxID=51669 RepID=UPI0023EA0247|nr:MerR family transcriptional regulator [Tetragenococcus halophilus]GMA08497.1 hypothetical protein GCM10025886_16480 [Tetragenococcus halophilus subsp. flandriensis]
MEKKNKFSIGEISQLTGVTVRTLQYYDNIQLVPLEKNEENGRRYYTKADLTRLQQVLFYKSLGLKIKDIHQLVKDTISTKQLTDVLEKQRELFYYKLHEVQSNIAMIDASLAGIKENKELALGNLVQLMISLNKDTIYQYADVSFDESSLDIFQKYYQKPEEVLDMYWKWKGLILEAVAHILNEHSPESQQGQDFAKRWLEAVVDITKGSQNLLEVHKQSFQNRQNWPEEDRRLAEFADGFIDQAVDYYLSSRRNEND